MTAFTFTLMNSKWDIVVMIFISQNLEEALTLFNERVKGDNYLSNISIVPSASGAYFKVTEKPLEIGLLNEIIHFT